MPERFAPLDLDHLPVVDHHCHPWREGDDPFASGSYRMLFTEGDDPRLGEEVPATVYYRWTLRELARVLGCGPGEAEVLAARSALGHGAVEAKLMAEAHVEAAILDDLYAGRGGRRSSVAEMCGRLGGARTYRALRLESVLETLVCLSRDAGEVEDRFRARLDLATLRAEGVVSLKSIVAYRTGLGILPVVREDAYAAFTGLKRDADRDGSVRIADKVFLDYFLRIALGWCGELRFPIQFHTGFGDTDIDPPTARPSALKHVCDDPAFREAPLVLLHAGYPDVRELGYLASVYANVHVDVGLAIPFAATGYETIFREALALAPTTKVLWSSDGFSIPEHTWFAARQGRRALGRVLGELVGDGAIDQAEGVEIATQVLSANSRRLYRLDDAAGPAGRGDA
ncbi:MAG: amidohydrolase [Chloroflexota bacterium]|nr:amidohydrolase [Chloroflexota bacterium]